MHRRIDRLVAGFTALLAMLSATRAVEGAIIPVTTLQQKVSGTGGCSLQEAIYSANLDSNVAVKYTGSTRYLVITQCVPGSGDDSILLPAGALLQMTGIVDDADNPTGPTATPIITSNITVWAYGATLQRTGTQPFRLFSIAATGHLTLKRAYVRGFYAQGGNGRNGGGGGMGAGGAIYVMGGGLLVEESTFEGNWAIGGTGGTGSSGGGGGLGGNGGLGFEGSGRFTGGGGGGARGHGDINRGGPPDGGGGGGTLRNAVSSVGGYLCGANGTHGGGIEAPCPGGGGSGGAASLTAPIVLPCGSGHDGGKGSYGGGGGGGEFECGGDGGRGGFGGGGGASGYAGYFGEDGGNGGFGGGGGVGTNGELTDGDPGNGGFFAGHATSSGGGGGAGLGGAIFNDSGSVEVRNSTFTANAAVGGQSETGRGASGGGGAIFSKNGQLIVLNATISLNQAVFGIGGGIMLTQDSAGAPTLFILRNTIVANNGDRECAVTGSAIASSFIGNLITRNADGSEFRDRTFVACPGVATSGDPQLGPLAYNQGATPTMAIGTNSPAWNAADLASSLGFDQRRQRRPAFGGVDIGAFELCLQNILGVQLPCVISGFEQSPEGTVFVQLTVQTDPPAGGTTTPVAGTYNIDQYSPVALTATPNPGYRFAGWSQNVVDPNSSSTTVVMNTAQVVTASFEGCDCAIDVTPSIGVSYSGVTMNPTTRRYVQTVTLKNNWSAPITGPISLVLDQLTTNVSLYNASGTTAALLPAGSPFATVSINLAAGQSVAIQLQFTNPGNVTFTYIPRVLAGPGSR